MDKSIGELTYSELTPTDLIPIERGGENFHLVLDEAIEKFHLKNPSSVIPCSTLAWTAGQSLTGVGISTSNTLDFLHRQVFVVSNTSSGGYLRQFMNMSGSGNWLPGKGNEIDANVPWRVSIQGNFTSGSSGYTTSFFFGGLSSGGAPTSAGDRTTKGWQIKIIGTGANTGNITAIAHNGTSAISGSPQTVSFLDGTLVGIDVLWLPADGLYVYVNGTLLASVTTSNGTMPSGLLTSSQNGWAIVSEHTIGTTAVHANYIRPLTVYLQQ